MINPVFGIPVSFTSEQHVGIKATLEYCDYLKRNGASRLMTTAGTSTFNLLSNKEIHDLNIEISKFNCETFLGLPAMSLHHTLEMVRKCNTDFSENSKLLLLFPERFYSYSQLIEYFISIADASKFPIYIHGKTIRNAIGGNYDYCEKVVNALSIHPNICGMKEEHPNLNKSFNQLANFNSGFETIVAGGSMRRFMFLNAAGASTFLTGVGNILPQIEIDFQTYINNNDLTSAKNLINEYETPMFSTFMKLGWHRALRCALHLMGFDYNYARKPFSVDLNKEDVKQVQVCIDNIKEYKK